jgi:hypothetical protein
MSIKVMAAIWDSADASGSELLVLLALADFANDDGGSIYPSIATVAKKARLSADQARRIIHKLIKQGKVELVQAGGWDSQRNRPNQYRINLERACILPGGVLPAREGGTRTMQVPYSHGEGGGTRTDASTVLAPTRADPSSDPSSDPPMKKKDDEEKARARQRVIEAWYQNIPGTLSPILSDNLHDLIDECGPDAVIAGITASVIANARNFKYIATCARNHAAAKTHDPRRQSNSAPAPARRQSQGTEAVDAFFAKLEKGDVQL